MKILYSHRTKSADGQFVHIHELTRALAARGHDIDIAGPYEQGETSTRRLDATEGSGGLKSRLPDSVYERVEYLYSVHAFLRLYKHWRKFRPDVLYERYNLFFHSGVWLKRMTGLPMILEVNAPLADERARYGGLALQEFARRSETAIWRAADLVLPVTGVLAERVKAAGVPEDRIAVIQNGTGPEFLSATHPEPLREKYGLSGKTILGFTGFVRDWHGVERVIRFIASSGRSDLHLLIVGDGPICAELKMLARALGIAGHVTITGIIQREEVPDHVALFDVALQPAVVEYASPLKLFEYMALGRAILAPANANICEVLTCGEDAMLFAPGDDAAFHKGLETLCVDKSLRERLGREARSTLNRRDFTWAGNASRVEAFAERLLTARDS